MPLESVLSLLVAVAALIFTGLSFRRNSHQDTSSNAAERASMTADIRYIRQSVDDIKLEYKAIQRDVVELREKLIRIDAAVQSAHQRIDDITTERRDDGR